MAGRRTLFHGTIPPGMQPFPKFSVLMLVAAFILAAAGQEQGIEILHPRANSVVRRQSVEIEVVVRGLQVPLEGYGRVLVDGRTIRCVIALAPAVDRSET